MRDDLAQVAQAREKGQGSAVLISGRILGARQNELVVVDNVGIEGQDRVRRETGEQIHGRLPPHRLQRLGYGRHDAGRHDGRIGAVAVR